MANDYLVEDLAKLLDLPIEVIQAFGKPQKPVTIDVARKKARGKTPARYATLKAGTETLPTKEVATPKDENELYTQWRSSSDAEKPELEKELFGAVLKHSTGVIWQRMHEWDEGLETLALDITSDAIKNVSRGLFKEQSKFSTYVQGIAYNKINEELERRIKGRNEEYVSDNPEYDINLRDEKAEAAFEKVDDGLGWVVVERLTRSMPREDVFLLHCVLDGMSMARASEALGVSEDAAESRWRRLRARLRKKIVGKGDGKRPRRATN